MKYRIIGAVACICILLVSVLNYPVLLTGRIESRRYHQHREATPKAVCAVHAEKEFCTHLPLIVIDTGGAEIPGRGLVDEEDRHMGFTTTAEGADRITAQMRVMDSAEENNHPTDAPAVRAMWSSMCGEIPRDILRRLVTDWSWWMKTGTTTHRA